MTTSSDGTEVALDTQCMMGRGQSLRGIIAGAATPEVLIPQLVDLYLQGRFPFDRLVKFHSFEQINMAIEDSERAGDQTGYSHAELTGTTRTEGL